MEVSVCVYLIYRWFNPIGSSASHREQPNPCVHPSNPAPPLGQSFTQYIWEIAYIHFSSRIKTWPPPPTIPGALPHTHTHINNTYCLFCLTLIYRGCPCWLYVAILDRESYSLFIFSSRVAAALHVISNMFFCHMFSEKMQWQHIKIYIKSRKIPGFLPVFSLFATFSFYFRECEHRAANIVFRSKQGESAKTYIYRMWFCRVFFGFMRARNIMWFKAIYIYVFGIRVVVIRNVILWMKDPLKVEGLWAPQLVYI